jgi:hypothetical protein
MMTKSDVILRPLSPTMCDECGDSEATHEIALELAGGSWTQTIGHFCAPCGNHLVRDLRSELPDQWKEKGKS